MKRENLLLSLDTIRELFEERNYHLLRVTTPTVTSACYTESRYMVVYHPDMKDALKQLRQGNTEAYNALCNKFVFDQPFTLEALLDELVFHYDLDVYPFYDVLEKHDTALKEFMTLLHDASVYEDVIPEEAFDTLDDPSLLLDSFKSLLLHLLSVELEYSFLECWKPVLCSVIDFAIDELGPAYQSEPYPVAGSDFHQKLKDNFVKLYQLTQLCC